MSKQAERAKAVEQVSQWYLINHNPPSFEVRPEREPHRENVHCVYQGESGERCAFSVLLTDEEREAIITSTIDDNGRENSRGAGYWNSRGVRELPTALLPERFRKDILFYGNLQACHDDAVIEGRDLARQKEGSSFSHATFLIHFRRKLQQCLADLSDNFGLSQSEPGMC